MTTQRTSAALRLVARPTNVRPGPTMYEDARILWDQRRLRRSRTAAAPRAGDLLPLDGAGGFGGDVVGDTVHAGNFVDDAA